MQLFSMISFKEWELNSINIVTKQNTKVCPSFLNVENRFMQYFKLNFSSVNCQMKYLDTCHIQKTGKKLFSSLQRIILLNSILISNLHTPQNNPKCKAEFLLGFSYQCQKAEQHVLGCRLVISLNHFKCKTFF